MKKRKLVFAFLGLVLLVVIGVPLWFKHRINASLPVLDATLNVTGIDAEVLVERDDHGIPTIHATSRGDAAFALGFLHGQDRFFQMDLLRRASAGRISEIIGPSAVSYDTSVKPHRFQELAAQVIAQCPPRHLRLLEAYSAGVNSGLRHLADKPFEYVFLRISPEPWRPVDSVLVSCSMLCTLQDSSGRLEYLLGKVRESLPAEAFRFVAPQGTDWDAPLDGTSLSLPDIPTADQWSIEKRDSNDTVESDSNPDVAESTVPGSNNWAVGGELTDDGRAILASDMHLGLSVPTIWYRVVMHTPASDRGDGPDRPDGRRVRLVGLTLPGTPALIAGSNGSVAWGFTNSMGDFGDLLELQTLDDNPDQFLTADGPEAIETVTHSIHAKGQSPVTIESYWTSWGPVTIEEPTADGPPRRFVHHWVGHDVEATDFNLIDLESVQSVDEAIKVANRCGMSHNNFVCADAAGQVGWTLAGRIPNRRGPPARTPIDSSAPSIGWDGYLLPGEYPRVVRPESHRVWTANSRVVGGQDWERLGGEYVLGARATQIRDRLFAKDQFSEQDLLNIQLDDEAILMQRWRDLLVDLTSGAEPGVSAQFIELIKEWDGHASADSVGYRIVSSFREDVVEDLDAALTAAAELDRAELTPFWGLQQEGFVWQLVTERPAHLLPEANSWAEYLLAHAQEVESRLTANQGLESATWGQRNTAAIQHPFSMAMPLLSGWLDMPVIPLSGDALLPRVQRPTFGASNRLVVAPGHEEHGILHLPGGQSGHPRSPFYRKGFEDWAQGNPSPLLPGPAAHRLVLQPR